LNSADAQPVNSSDLGITLVTPPGAPGISEDVVVLATFRSIADSSNGMVEVALPATGVIQNTTGVHCENILVGLDTDSDWLFGNSSLQLGNRFRRDVGIRLNANLTKRGIIFAIAIFVWEVSRGVWISGLKFLEVRLEVLEGIV